MGIPNYPGVPPLLGGFAAAPGGELLSGDDPSIAQASGSPQWGLYQNGQPVIVADSVVSLGVKATSTISTYPIEPASADQGGAFQSYDKVQLPFEGRMRYTTGGAVSDRTALITSIDAAKQSLDPYDLVMPEFTYSDVNVIDYEFDRKAATGLGLLSIDVSVNEVRITSAAQFSTTPGQTQITNAQNPGANTPFNSGTQSPQNVTGTQMQGVQQLIDTGNSGPW